MPMRQHKGFNFIKPSADIRKIREDKIHARLFLFREKDTAVNKEDMPVILDHIHIAAYLA